MPFIDDTAAWRTDQATEIQREQLFDDITVITPMRTPLVATLPRFRVRNRAPAWNVDELASAGTPSNGDADVQAFAENTDADFSAPSGPYQLFNRIHGFRETVSVSDRLNYMDTVGVEDVFYARMVKKIKEHVLKMEFALLHSVGRAPTGSGNDNSPTENAGKMYGLREQAVHGLTTVVTAMSASTLASATGWSSLPTACRGNFSDETESPGATLTEGRLTDLMELMWDDGAIPRDLWVPSVQKRYIANFTGQSTRNIEAESRALVRTIDVYEGTHGLVIVNLHPMMIGDEILCTDTGLLEVGVLKPTTPEQLARIGDAYRGMVETVITNIVRCPAALGLMFGLYDVNP